MTRIPLIVTLVAAAALAGCNNSEPEIVGGPPTGEAPPPVAPGELPPSIASSKIYRCTDNQIVNVDWLSDNKTANLRTEDGAGVTQLSSAGEGQPFTAEGGYEITGAPGDATVRIATPGKSARSCKA